MSLLKTIIWLSNFHVKQLNHPTGEQLEKISTKLLVLPQAKDIRVCECVHLQNPSKSRLCKVSMSFTIMAVASSLDSFYILGELRN